MDKLGRMLCVVCGLALAACEGKDKAGEEDMPGGSPDVTEVVGCDGEASSGEVAPPDVCVPDCEGKFCGPDGCGGTCGFLDPGVPCTDPTGCEYYCGGMECGPDECADICGTCEDGFVCAVGYTCIPECMPHCLAKECGPDGCGGVCGVCEANAVCTINAKCQCIPDCKGRICGSDGCGGSCGACDAESACTLGGKCECRASVPEWQSAGTYLVCGLGIGSGHPGHGLDVDGDVSTCAPGEDCESGIDNLLGGFADVLSEFWDPGQAWDGMIASGELSVVLDLEGVEPEAGATVSLYEVEPGAAGACAAGGSEMASATLLAESWDLEACSPLVVLANAELTGGHLTAGGNDNDFDDFPIPLPDAGISLPLHVRMLRLDALVETGANGDCVVSGVLGGCFAGEDLVQAAEELSLCPNPKGWPCPLQFLASDIDSDGDGIDDCTSFGLLFTARSVVLHGAGG